MALDAARHWALLVAGGLLLKAGRPRPAAAVLDRAAELNPQHGLTQSSRAIALLKLGRWEEAAAGFAAAIGMVPAVGDSRANLVIALLHLGRWDEAVVACRQAIDADPGRPTLHEHLGMALIKLERWEAAVEALLRAIELNRASTEANNLLHYALLKLERWDQALDALRRVIAREPHSAQLHRGLGGVLAHLERWEEAAAAVELSLSLDPNQLEGYVNLASFLTNLPASTETVLADQRAVDSAPDNAAAHLRLALGLASVGRWDEAAAALQRGGSLAPVNNVFQYVLVDPLMRLGRRQEALAAYRRAAAARGDRPRLPGEAPAERLRRRRASFWTQDNLRAEVFTIDRWLGRLASPPATAPASAASPRLLFLLDADYGELTTLMYLMLGRSLWGQSTLLLPDRLFEQNPDVLRGRTYRYATVDDVLHVVDRERPDIVFLCSGYLLSVHLLFSIEDLQRLVTGMRERGCRLVTADPFLGMLSKQDPRDLVAIDIPSRSDDEEFMRRLVRLKKVEDERLRAHFTACERIFRDTYHLYPAYCDVPPHDITDTDARNLSFYNPELVCQELAPRDTIAGASTEHGRPHWLFILSRTDYEAQQLFESLPVFIDLVVEKLLETLAAGRHPILIAPTDMIEALGRRMPTSEGVDMLAYCSFNRFTSLLLSAEYAFYWNVLSHSLLIRLFNKLPTIVFDRGHLIRNVPAMYPRVVQWYYQGWEPTLVDHRQQLTMESVAAWSESYRQNADRICERFRRAPTPEDMINIVLNNDPVPAPRNEVRSHLAR